MSGGNGGAGGDDPSGTINGGRGGNGGAGVRFVSGGTFVNSGTVTGGIGGAGGVSPGQATGIAGAGGAGIVGANINIINTGGGLISGGLAGDGLRRANAITFTGGSNFLNLNPSGTQGTLAGNIDVAGTVTFNQSQAVSLANLITGTGAVIQAGSGRLILSAANTYTGSTTVTGNSTLEVDGSIASSSGVIVSAGGTLTGTGTVADTQVNAGSTFAPGNGTAGTSMTIAGNLAFQSGATYLVQVSPATASFSHVSGTATLGGATVDAVFAGGTYVNKSYTILTATGGVSGTFAPGVVSTNLPANFATSLSYDASDVYLDLSLSFVPPPNSGLNRNQQAVANALVGFFNANGGIPAVYGGLTPAGLTQASGEHATAALQTTFDAMSQFTGLLTDPFMQRSGGVGPAGASHFADESTSAYAASKRTDAFAMFTKAPPVPFVPRWSVWGAGFGGSQSTSGNTVVGSNDTTSSIFGTAVGADYLLSPDTLAGFALAGGGTSFSVNGLGSGRSDLFQAGAYLRHTEGPAYISAALAYGWQDITTDRVVTIAGVDHLRAEFNANAYSGRVEGGYRLVAPWSGGIGITPYAAAQFTTFDLPAYAESVVSGGGAFALAYGARSATDPRSELGLRADKSFATRDGVLTLRGRLAWAHDFDPDRGVGATFQALPGASFVINGAAQARDSELTTASAEMRWMNGWSMAATFEGEFSEVTRSYAGKGVVRYQW